MDLTIREQYQVLNELRVFGGNLFEPAVNMQKLRDVAKATSNYNGSNLSLWDLIDRSGGSHPLALLNHPSMGSVDNITTAAFMISIDEIIMPSGPAAKNDSAVGYFKHPKNFYGKTLKSAFLSVGLSSLVTSSDNENRVPFSWHDLKLHQLSHKEWINALILIAEGKWSGGPWYDLISKFMRVKLSKGFDFIMNKETFDSVIGFKIHKTLIT